MQDCIQEPRHEGKHGRGTDLPDSLRAFGTRVLGLPRRPRGRRRPGRRQPRAGRPVGSPVPRLPAPALVRRPPPLGRHACRRRPRRPLRHRSPAAARRPRRHRPGAHRARPDDGRERARTHGVGVVGVRNSNHFGTAMYFTRRAAADGCVAVLTTNASPAMAPWGGREKRIGTNPWSIAAPGPGRPGRRRRHREHRRGRGKIYLAKNRGADPRDLGAHRRRRPDDRSGGGGARRDPADGRPQGLRDLVPDGRALRRADRQRRVGTGVHGPYEADRPSGAGHLFLALDPDAFGDRAYYETACGS